MFFQLFKTFQSFKLKYFFNLHVFIMYNFCLDYLHSYFESIAVSLEDCIYFRCVDVKPEDRNCFRVK